MSGNARHRMRALWQRIRLPGDSTIDYLGETNEVEPPLREGLFSSTQLESHARSLATDQKLAPRPGPEMLLRRLSENEDIISRSYEDVAEAIRHGRPRAPAAKWLVENISHFIRSYQTTRPLRLGELWAVPIMVNLALVENLRRVSRRIAWRRRQQQLAADWSTCSRTVATTS